MKPAGGKRSSKRDLILNVFMRQEGHLSADELYDQVRKDDPGMKRLVDLTISNMMASGELAKLYNKWFTSPIPPKNVSVNLPMGSTLKGLFANPNDKPMEDYAIK